MKSTAGVTVTTDDGDKIRVENATVDIATFWDEVSIPDTLFGECNIVPALPTTTITITARGARYIVAGSPKNVPDRYIVNDDAAILFKGDDKVVVKRRKDESPNRRLAFLEAYFQMVSGMSKTQAHKYLDKVEEEK